MTRRDRYELIGRGVAGRALAEAIVELMPAPDDAPPRVNGDELDRLIKHLRDTVAPLRRT